MKKFLLTSLIALAACYASADSKNANTTDTLRVTTTPVMHCSGCENKIKSNVRFVKGVKKIETSVPKQQVTIVYDKSKAKFEDFQAAFKKIGFDIKTVPAKK